MINNIDNFIKNLKKNCLKKIINLVSFNEEISHNLKTKYKDKPFYDYFTIYQLMEQISGLSLIPESNLFFYFFILLKQKKCILSHTFNHYSKWAYNILKDFQILDFNLTNIKNFFSYTISIEQINIWNINNGNTKYNLNITDNILFWQEIKQYYYYLNNELLKRKKGYTGMIFRQAISQLDNYLSSNHQEYFLFLIPSNLYFLNACEKKLINKIIKLNVGSIYYYHTYSKLYHNIFFLKKKNANNKIKIFSVSRDIDQINIIKKIIHKLIKQGSKLDQIIIILGDISLMELLSNTLHKLNIPIQTSIELPLYNILIHNTFYSILQLILNQEIYNKFYKQDILRVLSNGYIKQFLMKNNFSCIEKINAIDSDTDITIQIINKYIIDDLKIIFFKNYKNIFIWFLQLLKKFKNLLSTYAQQHILELKFILKLEKYITYIINTNTTKNINFGIQDLLIIYQHFITNNTIPYPYNNTKGGGGLKIIKFNNNFHLEYLENTIITSFNEGCIPPIIPNYIDKTFLSNELRKKFKIYCISNNKNNNKYYCQYFQNILNHSKNIFLLYNNEKDEFSSGEKSRFIHKMEINYTLYEENQTEYCNTNNNEKNQQSIIIKKTNYIINKLQKIANSGFSPSSIILYNKNKLDFYYNKILELKNLHTISFKQKIGHIVHKILDILYSPMKGNLLNLKSIHEMKHQCNNISKTVISQYQIKDHNNIFLLSLVTTYVNNFLSWDEQAILNGHTIFIKEIEYRISTQINQMIMHYDKVSLKGIIDRIDEYDGITRIIDYKIGVSKVKNIYISSNKIKNIFNNSYYGNIMQLLIYIYLWYNSPIVNSKISPVIAIVSPEKEKKNSISTIYINFLKKQQITYECYKTKIFPHLIKIISEILDPTIPMITNYINDF
ncbi:PD-(D/E)XK nuclease family protein [Blattabacterium cuenoti]|uniref:PD-(D/E)XK nuclease family protein n=1 Tax=Blattabacterium cuenoti TaxID=1653831 RepID=UPI00163BD5C3|nr:PD-(D/E)XK nuclease family protein [Blattabacterium cuenoti]